jgi:8-oxo-dGTP diphosphatase
MTKSKQGISEDRYTIIPRTLIFITRNDEVLLLKGAPGKRLWANQYNGIGGHIERGEDSLSSAQRELLEETGISDVELWLCGTVIVNTGKDIGIGIYIYRGEITSGDILESIEGKLEWIKVDQFNRIPLVEDLHRLLPRVLVMNKGNSPFSALFEYDQDGKVNISFGH